jgi:hypothetical protein
MHTDMAICSETIAMITSADEFSRLRRSNDVAEQARASHAAAPETVWMDVIRLYPDLRKWIAHNKTVPLEILRLLAQDDDPHVRRTVAMKRKLDQALFETLSADPDESVRRAIANNAKCPNELRDSIATTLMKEGTQT